MARTPGALNKRTRAALTAAEEGRLEKDGEKTIQYLLSIANDPEQPMPLRIQAANAALPYCKPKLASVEQTNIDARDQLDPAELEAKLVALLVANPHLLDSVLNLVVKAAPDLRGRLLAILSVPPVQQDTVALLTH